MSCYLRVSKLSALLSHPPGRDRRDTWDTRDTRDTAASY